MRPKDAPWLRFLAEGAVIVGSILLAFTLDAWWERQSRQADLKDQLGVIVGEMQSTREALQAVLGVHQLNAELAGHISAALREVADGSQVSISDTLVGPLFPQATADVTAGALEAFITDGGLDLIEDMEARRHLLAWPTRIDDLLDDEQYLRNFAAADLATHLRANYAVANAELMSIPLLRAQVAAGPPVDPGLLGTITFQREQQLMNLLSARESGERGMQASLTEMLDQVATIIAALEISK